MRKIARSRNLTGFWRDCRAGAAAELALILPGLAFIALNVTDLCVYVYSKMQVDLAAQQAAGAARTSCDSSKLPATTNCPNLQSTMTTAAQAATSLGTLVTLTSTVEKYYCADSTTGNLVAVATPPTAPPADCSSYASTSTASPPSDYIQVTASYAFSSVFPGASIAQLLPATITRTAWMRLQ